jgi:hypothetical protein
MIAVSVQGTALSAADGTQTAIMKRLGDINHGIAVTCGNAPEQRRGHSITRH